MLNRAFKETSVHQHRHSTDQRDYIRLDHWKPKEKLGIMGDSSASYIHMVQHLIEKCLMFHMTQEECMEALSKHANIKPVITSTVWKELEKENREFFEEYARNTVDRMSTAETTQKIEKIISESSTNRSSDEDEDYDD